MQTHFIFLTYLLLGNFLLPDSQAFPIESQQIQEGQYAYIYAPNGLNMREGPTTSFEKMTKIPYGAKVEIIVPAKEKNLTVDGLQGGMAKVSYEGYTGYAFDGYMTQFPTPNEEGKVRDYVEALRQVGHLVYYETVERDYDGYFQFEESIIIHKSNWEEAFLVAKQLFDIPPKLNFPLASSKTESIFINPDKEESAWSDELKVTRERGLITNLNYYFRAEGGGTSVNIAYFEPDSEAIKITQLNIAD